jgi:hypothetical protein
MDHDQVTLKHVMAESVKCLPLFHVYDKDNDKSAHLYLESALHPTLYKELDLCQMSTDSACTTWMRILHLCSNGSIEKYNHMKDELKSLSPLKEPGENVELYCTKQGQEDL